MSDAEGSAGTAAATEGVATSGAGEAGQGGSGAALLGGGTQATAGTTSAVAEANQNAATAAWVDSIADPGLKAYVTNKGWKDPADVAHGYQNLEKLLSGEKIPMPKGDKDIEGWNRMYKAIGRPETPDGYKLPAPPNGDNGFLTDAAKVFHEAGLSTKQANSLAKWYSEYGARITRANDDSITARNTQELERYKREQGAQFDAKVEMGRRAARQFGWSNEMLAAIDRQFGTHALLTTFAKMGEGLVEHVVAGEGQTKFAMSATQAQAALTDLKQDREFIAKYTAGDADAKARMFALQAAAAGMSVDDYRAALGNPTNR